MLVDRPSRRSQVRIESCASGTSTGSARAIGVGISATTAVAAPASHRVADNPQSLSAFVSTPTSPDRRPEGGPSSATPPAALRAVDLRRRRPTGSRSVVGARYAVPSGGTMASWTESNFRSCRRPAPTSGQPVCCEATLDAKFMPNASESQVLQSLGRCVARVTLDVTGEWRAPCPISGQSAAPFWKNVNNAAITQTWLCGSGFFHMCGDSVAI